MIYLDMFDFLRINTVFNGADSFVCIGAALLVLALILEMKEEIKKEKLAKEASAEAHSEEGEE
jgi:lipoprotein signal peptidase